MKTASKSAITRDDRFIVGQAALTINTQRLESKLLMEDDYAWSKTETSISLPEQHSKCEELSPELYRKAKNGYFVTDVNNLAPDLSGEPCENPIKGGNVLDERAVRSLRPVNNLHKCTLVH